MQLKLFSGKENKIMRVGSKKARVKPRVANSNWNLWTAASEGEKQMVLLFLDIRNFTPLVEECVAVDVIHLMKKLFVSFQNTVQLHNGKIIETTGDGFYAAFGLDRNIDEACNDAVKCGYSILKSLEIRNQTLFETSVQKRLDVGIGIHAGKVATGYITLGTEKHMMVMGYAVNVASRIQSATKTFNNNFLVSADVFDNLNFKPSQEYVDANLKGVKDIVRLFTLGRSYN